MHHVLEWGVSVALISEPCATPDSPSWLTDLDGDAAIFWNASRCVEPCLLVRRGHGYVVASMGETILVSLYISPNCPLLAYIDFLRSLSDVLEEYSGVRVIIAGDFNARSVAWGDRRTNGRGDLLAETMAALDLRIVNEGDAPTCIRPQGKSVIDLTWASAGAMAMITNWRVIADETLSDHACIRFDVGGPGDVARQQSPFPRWSLRSFDSDRFGGACEAICWSKDASRLESSSPEELAVGLRDDLIMACDVGATRHRPCVRGSAYWWTDKIGELRRICIRARRRFTKLRVRQECEERRLAESEYLVAKREFRLAIAAAKEAAWEALLSEVDRDPWGRPYRVVLKRLGGGGLLATESMSEEELSALMRDLFPAPAPVYREPLRVNEAESDWSEGLAVASAEVRRAIKGKKAGNTAPGLDGIPKKFLKTIPSSMSERIQAVLNVCLRQGVFPDVWKRARLALIPKAVAPGASPKYRPICMIDELGKVFERVIVERLHQYLNTLPNGGISERQFGFRVARSTVEPLLWLRDSAQTVINERRFGIAISVDIKNAFNSIPHEVILDALVRKGIPNYLRDIVASYLNGRVVVCVGKNGRVHEYPVLAGVPQGSILGPLLWILVFDYVLDLVLPQGSELTCYADDTLLFVRGDTPEETLRAARLAAALVLSRIEELGLVVAIDKTEALWFYGGRVLRAPSSFYLREYEIHFGKTLKYLGVFFDGHTTFKAHFEAVERRAAGVVRALGRLMPNLRGPGEAKRRLYANCVHSVILYAAPVWSDSFGLRAAYRKSLCSLQRIVALRVARAYRTVSFVASTLLARIPPLSLLASKRRRVYERVREERLAGECSVSVRREIESAADIVLVRQWKNFIANETLPGRRVVQALLPCLDAWLSRSFGLTTHYMTQVLTGHGVFADYLCRIGRLACPECWLCGAPVDDADHTLQDCSAFELYRVYLTAAIGEDLSLPGIMTAILASDRKWKAFSDFCRWVIEEKMAVEREREREDAARNREGDVRVLVEAGVDPERTTSATSTE